MTISQNSCSILPSDQTTLNDCYHGLLSAARCRSPYAYEVIDFDLENIKSRLDKDDYDYVLSILGGELDPDEASPYVKELHGIFSMYDQKELKSLLMAKFDKEEFSDFSAFDNGLY